MNNVTRLTAWISGALLAFGLATAPAPAQASRAHDVHVTAVDQFCVNQSTAYEFRLENLSGERRTVRGSIARRGRFTETFSRSIRSGATVQRVVIQHGERARVTFRSEGRVVMRARLSGQCRKPNPLA